MHHRNRLNFSVAFFLTILILLALKGSRVPLCAQETGGSPNPRESHSSESEESKNAWRKKIFEAVESHFDRYHLYGIDSVGATRSGVWCSEFDTRSLRAGAQSNLYQSLGMVANSIVMSERTGCKCYSEAATAHLATWFHLSLAERRELRLDNRLELNLQTDRMKLDSGNAASNRRSLGPAAPSWEPLFALDDVTAEKTLARMTLDLDLIPLKEMTAENAIVLLDALAFLTQRELNEQDDGTETAIAIRQCVEMADQIDRELISNMDDRPEVNGMWLETLVRMQKQLFLDGEASAAGDVLIRRVGSRLVATWDETRLFRSVDPDPGFGRKDPNRLVELRENHAHPLMRGIGLHAFLRYTGEARRTSPSRSASSNKVNAEGQRCLRSLASQVLSKFQGDSPKTAEDYGYAIRLLASLADDTGEPNDEMGARMIAEQAYQQLYVPDRGMFRSRVTGAKHSTSKNDDSQRPESLCRDSDGIGILIASLLEIS